MADFTLAYESITEEVSKPVLVSQSIDGSESRRLVTSKRIASFELITAAVGKAALDAYQDHYDGQDGPLTSFNFVSPFDDQTYVVRYDGPIRKEASRGLWVGRFKFIVVPELAES